MSQFSKQHRNNPPSQNKHRNNCLWERKSRIQYSSLLHFLITYLAPVVGPPEISQLGQMDIVPVGAPLGTGPDTALVGGHLDIVPEGSLRDIAPVEGGPLGRILQEVPLGTRGPQQGMVAS